ncbi:MAG TPA: CPBP family intramembrane glutamic endopeptidase [Gemmataceae bacterium]|nr:CPBP family intramembrane glutamic endopeptidase [Gemmataceae bacterium]
MSDELPESPESDMEARRQSVVSLAILVEGGLLAGASLLGWMLDQPPLRFFNWTPWAVLWGVAATVPLLALFFVFLRWPIKPFERIQRFSDEVIRPLLAPCSWIDLLGISVLAGLGEEVFFRGVLQEAACQRMPLWAGVLAASVLFGLLHFITFTYAVLATLMGVYLGWVWFYADHNLLVIVITHALYDFIVLLWLLRGPGAAEALEELQARQDAEKSQEPPD